MAHGTHWEWRGFGGVKSSFAKYYYDLPLYIEPHQVEDLYLWIPGLSVNSKFRSGAENGLKFKRPKDKDGPFEKWIEDPEEIFAFPLSEQAWNKLSSVIETAYLKLPSYPQETLDRSTTQKYLNDAGCKTVTVNKHRETRIWNAPNGDVLIEWTALSEPQSVITIGLENSEDFHSADFTDEMAKSDLKAAIAFFDLDKQPLHVMNYVDALKIWSAEQKIES